MKTTSLIPLALLVFSAASFAQDAPLTAQNSPTVQFCQARAQLYGPVIEGNCQRNDQDKEACMQAMRAPDRKWIIDQAGSLYGKKLPVEEKTACEDAITKGYQEKTDLNDAWLKNYQRILETQPNPYSKRNINGEIAVTKQLIELLKSISGK